MDMQTIGEVLGLIFLIGTFSYGWYQNDKFEKAGGWSGKPKTNKAK